MRRISVFIIGCLAGGAIMYGGLTHHLLRTSDGWELIPKSSATFDDSFVDVRKFTLSDWAEHRELVAAIVKAQKEQILGGATQNTLEQSAGRVFDEIRRQ